ncbi:phytanoyl-CoA dioxygenase family protein [Piscirickettsia salmonis]|uniref:phytanoyl-CoA dioxygenase family protein n=1 Tax=Piscirickettsia salmonis TaxID=1238 RepID=UPI000F085C3A|nr:hypothetical protein DA717_02320 [Piscirickettsiaceae bacterium NZ-RLO2]
MKIVSEIVQLETSGWLIIKDLLSQDEVDLCRKLIDQCEVAYQPWQAYRQPGVFHHLPLVDYRFLRVLERLADSKILNDYFDHNNFILNSFGGAVNNKTMDKNSYLKEIHRDVNYYIKNYPLMMNVLIMLDPFSKVNGAIEILPGSHKVREKPSADEFNTNNIQVLSNAGDVLFFNSYVWHRAGISETLDKRRALTLTYTPSYFKPQADYSEIYINLPDDMKNEFYKAVLGKSSKIVKNLDEWYIDYEK